jgi:hypothetical protein
VKAAGWASAHPAAALRITKLSINNGKKIVFCSHRNAAKQGDAIPVFKWMKIVSHRSAQRAQRE